ncbi:hypothetical protein [Microbacterium sp. NPDC089695]|uniref:flagellar hook-length control protein FliK n=1 Tax=Microbacterium sp. NPDC089695 TaxID=3364198 RepID=UPI00382468D9
MSGVALVDAMRATPTSGERTGRGARDGASAGSFGDVLAAAGVALSAAADSARGRTHEGVAVEADTADADRSASPACAPVALVVAPAPGETVPSDASVPDTRTRTDSGGGADAATPRVVVAVDTAVAAEVGRIESAEGLAVAATITPTEDASSESADDVPHVAVEVTATDSAATPADAAALTPPPAPRTATVAAPQSLSPASASVQVDAADGSAPVSSAPAASTAPTSPTVASAASTPPAPAPGVAAGVVPASGIAPAAPGATGGSAERETDRPAPAPPASAVVPAPVAAPSTVTPSVDPTASAATPRALTAQVSPVVMGIAQRPAGTHQITMTVNPDTLGPVTVRAHIGQGGDVRVELIGATDAGRDALRALVTDLRRDLAAAMPHATLSIAQGAASDAGADRGGQGLASAAGDQGSADRGSGRETTRASERVDPAPADLRPLPTTTASAPGSGLDILA